MSLHKEQVKTLVTQDRLSELEADRNKRISEMEKELETLQVQIEKEKQSLASMKSASLQKTEVINNLTRGIEEWRQKVDELKQMNANLSQRIY